MNSVSDPGRFSDRIAVLLRGCTIFFEFPVGTFPVGARFSDLANRTEQSRTRGLRRVATEFGPHHKGDAHV